MKYQITYATHGNDICTLSSVRNHPHVLQPSRAQCCRQCVTIGTEATRPPSLMALWHHRLGMRLYFVAALEPYFFTGCRGGFSGISPRSSCIWPSQAFQRNNMFNHKPATRKRRKATHTTPYGRRRLAQPCRWIYHFYL